MQFDDTIVAVSTPPGRGGIGVVRLAGAQARAIAAPMVRLRSGGGLDALQPNRAALGELVEPETGEKLDEIIVTFFAARHSYTGEDVLEISAHGAPVLLRHIVELCLERGARLAQPGEYTMRAFLNGRMDLTQAEAVRDLIDAQTLYQAKSAAQQLEGALSRRIQPVKSELVRLIAALEAGVDFAEDDVSVLPPDQILERIAAVRGPLQQLHQSFAFGKIVHEGVTLAIVGAPNVGKSSLFNRLVERERAIVTAVPGTTRDLVTETVSLEGIPVRLVDTAGIRVAADEAETMGVEKSYQALAEADLVLVVSDLSGESAPMHIEANDRLRQALAGRKSILVENKSDLAPVESVTHRSTAARGDSRQPSGALISVAAVRTSALTGEGIPELRARILEELSGRTSTEQEPGFLTNVRQQSLVAESVKGLDAAEGAVRHRVPHEMLLLDLYSTLRPLDALTGETTADDILNLIFGTFCIGK